MAIYPTSEKVEFNIEVEKEYYAEKPIEIRLVWKNKSDKTEKIMIRDYWEHPIFREGYKPIDNLCNLQYI